MTLYAFAVCVHHMSMEMSYAVPCASGFCLFVFLSTCMFQTNLLCIPCLASHHGISLETAMYLSHILSFCCMALHCIIKLCLCIVTYISYTVSQVIFSSISFDLFCPKALWNNVIVGRALLVSNNYLCGKVMHIY